jgi:hypothetical protein
MNASINSATTEMRKLRNEFVRRLMSNPDYRALIALDKAIAEVESAPEQSRAALGAQTACQPQERPDAFRGQIHVRPSHANAAIAVLTRTGHPMPLSALLPLAREEGAQVKGQDPEINFSSSLSRNERLRSVRYEGRSCWWLADRPFQGEKDFGGVTGANSPAADVSHDRGGNHAAP